MKRNWKKYFLILLSINLIVVIFISLFILWPAPSPEKREVEELDKDQYSEFIIRTTKANLNELVNAYLEQLLQDTKHHYQISLEDDVHLQGELPVFSATVPLSIHLEPLVQDDGNIILKQKSISVGLLELPNKQIMKYMKRFLPVPEWVDIDPNKEEIYVAVTDMEMKSNFQVQVDHFDLEANHIAMKIKVPYETLGIESSHKHEESK